MIICQYCGSKAILVSCDEVYPHRPDLEYLKFYLCKTCGAFVGCNKKTGEPLGTLANKELRGLRSEAHKAFDPLWKDGLISRTDAYKWLSERLCINPKDCHIGLFNDEMCLKVIEICERSMDQWHK